MEIQRQPADDRAKALGRIDITRPNREAIAESNPPISPPEPRAAETREVEVRDRVEVSATGRQVAERVRAGDRADDQRRAERVRDLKAAHERGDLNTDARVEHAAVRLLEGE